MHAIGIDIGGTKIAAALVAESGEILAEERRATPTDGTDAVVDTVVDLIRGLSRGVEVASAGVACAGFVDAEQSIVYYTPNLAFRNELLRDRLAARVGLSITIDNDANAAGWGEFAFGAGRGYRDMTMLTIGTGVGGAIVTGGGLFRGGFGTGGEIGHLRVVPDGRACGCGAHGCLEQYGSGRALLRVANEIADAGGAGRALAAARGGAASLTGDQVAELIVARDPGAMSALREIGDWLGAACASLAALIDPQIFVFGGGVAVADELLLDPIRESFFRHLPARGFHPAPTFAIAELANDAGVVGAADLARLHVATQGVATQGSRGPAGGARST